MDRVIAVWVLVVIGAVMFGVLGGVQVGGHGAVSDGDVSASLERIERGLFRPDSRLVRDRDASIERRLEEIEALVRRSMQGGSAPIGGGADLRETARRVERIEDVLVREVSDAVEELVREVESIGRRVEGFDRGGLGRAGRSLEDLDRRLGRIERRLESIERRLR